MAGAPATPALPLFTVALVDQVRPDVRAWQQVMSLLGWTLTVHGRYGPRSARATSDFEVSQGLRMEAEGKVGPQVRAGLSRSDVDPTLLGERS